MMNCRATNIALTMVPIICAIQEGVRTSVRHRRFRQLSILYKKLTLTTTGRRGTTGAGRWDDVSRIFLFLRYGVGCFVLFRYRSNYLFYLTTTACRRVRVSQLNRIIRIMIMRTRRLENGLRKCNLTFTHFRRRLFGTFRLTCKTNGTTCRITSVRLRSFYTIALANVNRNSCNDNKTVLSRSQNARNSITMLRDNM